MLATTKGLAAAKLIGAKLLASKMTVGAGAGAIMLATGIAVAPYEVSDTVLDDTGATLTAVHEPKVISDATGLIEEPAVPAQIQITENRDYEKYMADGHLASF